MSACTRADACITLISFNKYRLAKANLEPCVSDLCARVR
jgi:hypothetical protein